MANDVLLAGPGAQKLEAFYHSWHQSVPLHLNRGRARLVYGLTAVLCVTFLLGMVTPIGVAVPASGRLIAEGKNRIVEHLEGGIVNEVLVREGERVELGQTLARVNVTSAIAKLNNLTMQRDVARIGLARYLAERSGERAVEFPPDLVSSDSDDVRSAIATQREEFAAKKAELEATRTILEQRITSNQSLIQSLTGILRERQSQLANIQEELRVSDNLLGRGLTTRDRTYALRRQLAYDQDQIKSTIIQIDEKTTLVNEAREQLNRVLALREKEVTDEILKLRAAIFEAGENIRLVRDITSRSEIKAPVSGVVVKVATNTKDQVTKPGEPLFEIFPDDLPLAVDIQLDPHYIESVYVGQQIVVRFPSRERASSMRSIDGTITFVSRDSQAEPKSGRYFYAVRASLDNGSLKEYGKVAPGNLAEVYIRLPDQSLFWYLLEPLIDTKQKAFVG